jgi:hypothetical protein
LIVKGAVILAIILIGLDLFGRWTGATFSLNLLGFNQIGSTVKGARTG